MNETFEDYLWEKSGKPDAEVERLEALLTAYRFERPFVFPVARPTKRFVSRRWLWVMAAAAACVLFAMAVFLSELHGPVKWQARRSEGDPRLNGRTITGAELLRVGEVITTDERSEVELKAGKHGYIRVLPGTTVRLLQSATQHERLELQHGTIEASLYAPPFMFSFDTPSGTAYDIGCAFTLSVGEGGKGRLRVTSGWVQFEVDDKQELAPAGTAIVIEPGFGPGTPFFEDAPPRLQEALAKVDFDNNPTQRAVALNDVMTEARTRDVYTLLQLMRNATPPERALLFDRASTLRAPPASVTRDGIVMRNEQMYDDWVASLGLGNAKRWWVHWSDRF
jgi:hypothetical protein